MRYTKVGLGLAVFCAVLFVGLVGGVAGADHAEQTNETLDLQDPSGVEIATGLDAAEGETQLLVTLAEPASPAGETTVEQLQTRAAQSQSVLERFAARTDGVTVERTFWLTNAALVSVDADRVSPSALARIEGVETIQRNARVQVLDGESNAPAEETDATDESTAASASDTTADSSTTTDVGPTTTPETTYGLAQIGASEVWDTYGTRGENTSVAVLDTGVDPTHPEINLTNWAKFDRLGNVNETAEPQDFDPDGHGTHVSGTATGGSAGGQHIGVAPNTTLHHGAVIPSCGEDCFGFPTQIIGGMEWAINNSVDVISMSIVVPGYGSTFVDVVQNAEATGTAVVVSAGNQGHHTSTSPANVYDSIAVGAANEDRDITSFSSGERVDTDVAWSSPPAAWPGEYVVPTVSAPGAAVNSSIPGGNYDLFWGTSMAAPHVAGSIALIDSATDSAFSPDEIERALEQTATKPADTSAPAGERDTRYGSGIIDVPAALAFLTEPPSATFTYQPTRPDPGERVTFDANHSVGDIERYNWTFGNGETATGETANTTFETAGEYNVTLTVTNATGASDTVNRTLTVQQPPVEQRWSFDTSETLQSSPTVVTLSGETHETVFTGTNNNSVVALNATTGEKRWRFETDGLVRSSPTVADDTLFVGGSGQFGSEGRVYALDAATGDKRWQFDTGGVIRSSPTVIDVSTGGSPASGTVLVGSDDGNVSALDAETGQRHWRFEVGSAVRSSPTIANVSAGDSADNQTVFVGSSDGNLSAIDVETGQRRWQFETGDTVTSSPTVANVSDGPSTVFVGSSDERVYALNASTGEKRWDEFIGDPVTSTPTVADITPDESTPPNWTVFVGAQDENLYALDAATGTERWEFVTGAVVDSSPTVANGTVFVGSSDNRVYAVNATSGDMRWRFFTGGAVSVSPVVVNGTVFVGSNDGNVYALETEATASSDGSRVIQGTLGHHYAWATQDVVGPPRIVGSEWPRDTTGDGLYEDVRGDGTVDVFDVQALFANLGSPILQDNAPFFNFQEQNADEVTIFDVQALFTATAST